MKILSLVTGMLIGFGLTFIQESGAEQQPIQTVMETKFIPQIEVVKVNQTEPVEMEITEYTSGYESTQKHPGEPGYGITSSGTKARLGVCAADTDVLPIGTTVYIQGIGKCHVEDTGSAVKGLHIDVWTEKVKDALEFGRQTRKVWILKDY